MRRMLQASDDNTLVDQALRGDREAFRVLVDRHYDMIYRVAYRYLGSAADAEDVIVLLDQRSPRFAPIVGVQPLRHIPLKSDLGHRYEVGRLGLDSRERLLVYHRSLYLTIWDGE